MTGRYANVIIDIAHESVDKSFQYLIPDNLMDSLEVGDCVEVPFGKGNTLRNAYVVEITDKCDYPPEKMKSVRQILSDMVSVEQDAMRIASWMRETYGSTMISALKTVLPAKKEVKPKVNRKLIRKMTVEEIRSLLAETLRKKQSAKARILKELVSEEILPYDLVLSKLNVSASTIRSLQAEGALSVEVEKMYRNPVSPMSDFDKDIQLSQEQKYIVDTISEKAREGIAHGSGAGRYLIHGITGAGKTEVYIRLIEEAVKDHKQCILLIPEIALTYQTLMRFYKHFKDRVSVINSSLSQGEKFDQCRRAREGDIDVIIGPRSALFVPFSNLGLIIIDEEQEPSYISEQNPRYHARETAEEICRLKNAALVLGSATPTVESYYLSKTGYYELFKLTRRLTGGELPKVSIVDLREELRKGNKSVFSEKLMELMRDRLEKKEQIMLYLNRRGYSSFISCRACGAVVKCPHCDVSLTRHRGGILYCHYCGYSTEDVKVCPECGSKYISAFKAGTQKIEEAVNKLFPEARVLRMDADTTREKNSYEKILTAFKDGEADIMVGTQMIVKGHDFPNVTLVGILAADVSLNDSDFRTGERTFQLLTQAVGRAGRGEKPGEAVIQTYRPDHYSIVKASSQDYEAFYEEEIAYRMIGDYPPCGAMIKVNVGSRVEKRALGLATALSKRVGEKVRVIGPAPDVVSKVNDIFYYNLFLKSSSKDALIKTRKLMEEYLDTAPLESETVNFTVL